MSVKISFDKLTPEPPHVIQTPTGAADGLDAASRRIRNEVKNGWRG